MTERISHKSEPSSQDNIIPNDEGVIIANGIIKSFYEQFLSDPELKKFILSEFRPLNPGMEEFQCKYDFDLENYAYNFIYASKGNGEHAQKCIKIKKRQQGNPDSLPDEHLVISTLKLGNNAYPNGANYLMEHTDYRQNIIKPTKNVNNFAASSYAIKILADFTNELNNY